MQALSAVTRALAPIDGGDFRLFFEPAPGGLNGAVLSRVQGRFTGAALLAAYAVLVHHAEEGVLNVIADTRGAESFLDFAAYDAVTRLITAHGILRLNLVVCERDAGRRYVVKFGNEVAELGGLEVRSAFVSDLESAFTALGRLMADDGRAAMPWRSLGSQK